MGVFAKLKQKSAVAEGLAGSVRDNPNPQWQPPPKQHVELGTIDYVNLTADGKHGDFDAAINIARLTGKTIFANFVEWSG
ncbi:unnamed protein product [Cylindrotheca closterium]|uniref:Uncharacterized protein n=1 Tax=Cylindrotheca closterium TaxID=2856 RepID=A0AAD2G0I0_9STRA|nr:unnamed protein product [Cylindrotheca closterium]